MSSCKFRADRALTRGQKEDTRCTDVIHVVYTLLLDGKDVRHATCPIIWDFLCVCEPTCASARESVKKRTLGLCSHEFSALQ